MIIQHFRFISKNDAQPGAATRIAARYDFRALLSFPPDMDGLAVHLEGGNESFLRDIHLPELPHLLLPGLLLVQQLPLPHPYDKAKKLKTDK
nr:hypothetical protein [uncultured Tateyamaria sp.]